LFLSLRSKPLSGFVDIILFRSRFSAARRVVGLAAHCVLSDPAIWQKTTPDTSQDAILGNANLSIVTWIGVRRQMRLLEDFSVSAISVISGKVLLFWLTVKY